jgi:hypothetical protein
VAARSPMGGASLRRRSRPTADAKTLRFMPIDLITEDAGAAGNPTARNMMSAAWPWLGDASQCS